MALGVGNSVVVQCAPRTGRRDPARLRPDPLPPPRRWSNHFPAWQPSVYGEVHAYASAGAVAADEPPAAVEAAANVYFSQVPFPRNFMLGSQILAIQPSLVFGTGPVDVATVEALGDNTALTIGAYDFTADFDGLNTLAGIAGALQAGLNAQANIAGAAVTVDGTALIVNVPSPIDIGDGFTDTPASRALGMAGGGVVVLADVPAAETLITAADRIEMLDCSFYWWFLPRRSPRTWMRSPRWRTG